MRTSVILLGTLGAVLFGCSGGSESVEVTLEPVALSLEAGVVRPDQPTAIDLAIVKPFVPPGRVELVAANGSIAPEPDALPADAGQGIDFTLPVVVQPPAVAGTTRAEGTITLRFTRVDGEFTRDVVVDVGATVEEPTVQLANGVANFEFVATGETRNRLITVRNPNQATPVQVTAVEGIPDGFALDTRLPLNIIPGRTGSLTVRGTPASVGDVSAPVTISTSLGTTLEGTVRATVIPDEVVVDFGAVAVDPTTFETEELAFTVGPNAVSFGIEVTAAAGELIFLASLVDPDGNVFVDESDVFGGPYIWGRNIPFDQQMLLQVPNTDRPEVQLTPGGGEYRFKLAISPTSGANGVRVIIEQRGTAGRDQATLDLNVFLADGIEPEAATAPGDERLEETLSTIDAILASAGLRIGQVSYFDVPDPTLDDIPNDADFRRLLRESAAAPEERVNLFFVRSIGGGDIPSGVLGVSGAIPGIAANGTDYSGVMTAYEGFTTFELGSTSAHEIGHYLGLFHPVEQNGSHDFIDDTLECHPFLADAICPEVGANYLMHWSALGTEGIVITEGQALVLRGHPLTRAGLPPFESRLSGRAPSPSELTFIGPPTLWCPHCAGHRR